VDKTDEVPERYWVFRAFLHYEALTPDNVPSKIHCAICGALLISVGDTDADKTALLMFHDKPICPTDALEQIKQHPITATYMKWMEDGDPRWWSPWFCNCAGCEPLSEDSSTESSG
jgi:hypothetical protein